MSGCSCRLHLQTGRSRLLCLAAVAAVVAAALLRPEITDADAARVLIMVHPSRMEPNQYYHRVIAESTEVELQHAGFFVILGPQVDQGLDEGNERGDRPLGEKQLLELGSRLDADFLLDVEFVIAGSNAELDFSWYEMARGRLAGTARIAVSIDLSFDQAVSKAIRQLIVASGASPVSSRQERSFGTGVTQEDAAASDANQAQDTSESGRRVLDPDVPLRKGSAHGKPFEIAIGFAAFLVNGPAIDYFDVALAPALAVDYRIPLGAAYLGAGLFAAANLFNAVGSVATSESALVPIGVSLRCGFAEHLPVGVFLRLCGGAALLTIDPDESGRLWKTVPFGLVSLGAAVHFGSRWGMNLEAAYSAYVEQVQWIYGFCPSLYLYLRL
ncbi:MAG: hypothetical protein JW820_05355 [Spirochaetales bacterium]|nr:hypothetical protein [Spirochaetales bacterium]